MPGPFCHPSSQRDSQSSTSCHGKLTATATSRVTRPGICQSNRYASYVTWCHSFLSTGVGCHPRFPGWTSLDFSSWLLFPVGKVCMRHFMGMKGQYDMRHLQHLTRGKIHCTSQHGRCLWQVVPWRWVSHREIWQKRGAWQDLLLWLFHIRVPGCHASRNRCNSITERACFLFAFPWMEHGPSTHQLHVFT